jgi:hypothetical protein
MLCLFHVCIWINLCLLLIVLIVTSDHHMISYTDVMLGIALV